MAPPPIPNRPARKPDSAPTATSKSANSASSETPSPPTAISASPVSRPACRVHESCFRYTSQQQPPTLSTPTIAGHIHRCEPRFANDDFHRCAHCFEFVNRICLSRSTKGLAARQPVKAADDRQDRTTAL